MEEVPPGSGADEKSAAGRRKGSLVLFIDRMVSANCRPAARAGVTRFSTFYGIFRETVLYYKRRGRIRQVSCIIGTAG